MAVFASFLRATAPIISPHKKVEKATAKQATINAIFWSRVVNALKAFHLFIRFKRSNQGKTKNSTPIIEKTKATMPSMETVFLASSTGVAVAGGVNTG